MKKLFGFVRRLVTSYRAMDVTFEELVEIHRLNIKAGMRCAYDLRHASTALFYSGDKHGEATLYEERASRWIQIFDPERTKYYRDQLHYEITNLEMSVKRYRDFLKEKGIEDPFPDAPF